MEKERKKSELPPCIDMESCKSCLFKALCIDQEELEMMQAKRDCSEKCEKSD